MHHNGAKKQKSAKTTFNYTALHFLLSYFVHYKLTYNSSDSFIFLILCEHIMAMEEDEPEAAPQRSQECPPSFLAGFKGEE